MHKRKNSFVIFGIALILLVSCMKRSDHTSTGKLATFFFLKETVVDPIEMKEYVVDMEHGLIKSKIIDEVTFSAKYKPVDYIIANEIKENVISKTVYKKMQEELSGMQYFDLRIEIEKMNGELLKYGLSTEAEYEERVNYLAFTIKDDIKLIDGSDTLNCVLHHFERVYDIVPYATILLGFKNYGNDLMHEKTLMYHDKLFGKGIIKFTFLPADLQSIPHLEIIS